MASKEKTVSLISSPPKKPRRKYDQGSQYNSKEFKELLRKNGFRQSMSRKNEVLDNAFAESFFSRYKAELLQNGVFDHYEQAYFQTFEYIEAYFNRIQATLGHQLSNSARMRKSLFF